MQQGSTFDWRYMMKTSQSLWILAAVVTFASFVMAGVIHVPRDYITIQAGIVAAADGDTVLVAPGEYQENITIENKTIVLGSWFATTQDTGYISRTIIDGSGQTIITVHSTVGEATTIAGLTLRNGRNGIAPYAKIRILHNHISGCEDGVDYSKGSGGLCRGNLIEHNRGEGLDLDEDVELAVEDNIIRNNRADGIEIRLQPYSGPRLILAICRNVIYGNGQDGIQLVDSPDSSRRVFYIERNLVFNNAAAGLGCTGEDVTRENYEGADVREPIYLLNNTFVGNNYGITGGDNLLALNNVIASTKMTAMKKVDGQSLAAYNTFFDNGVDFDRSNRIDSTILYAAPLLDANYRLTRASPCIDAGAAFFIWQGDTVVNFSRRDYNGAAPDIGAFEYEVPAAVEAPVFSVSKPPTSPALLFNYPNPFHHATRIAYQAPVSGALTLKLYDGLGRLIRTLVNEEKSTGVHSGVTWDGRDEQGIEMASGIYFLALQGKNFKASQQLFLLR
jgi:hypothetical protein